MIVSKREWRNLPEHLTKNIEAMTTAAIQSIPELNRDVANLLLRAGAAAALKSVNLLPNQTPEDYKPYSWLDKS